MSMVRAILASAGAGGSLVAAGVCALAVFSTFVAVRGLPGVVPEPSVADVRFADAADTADADRPGGSDPIELADAASPPAASRAAGSASRERRSTSRERRAPVAPSGTVRRPARPTAPVTSPSSRVGDSDSDSGSGDGGGGEKSPARALTDAAGDAVRDTGDAVRPVAPPVGDAVEESTGAVGDAVEETTGAVGDAVQDTGATLDGVLP